jgi:hypothetical protein
MNILRAGVLAAGLALLPAAPAAASDAVTIGEYRVEGAHLLVSGTTAPWGTAEVHLDPLNPALPERIEPAPADERGYWTAALSLPRAAELWATSGTAETVHLRVYPTGVRPTLGTVTTTPLGGGLVRLAVTGSGDDRTLVRAYRRGPHGSWVRFLARSANVDGSLSTTIRASVGRKIFRIAYTRDGAGTDYRNVTVRVR